MGKLFTNVTPTHIGGFFGLEPEVSKGENFHDGAIALNTGRACISVMVELLNIRRIFLPYYACGAVSEPFKIKQIPINFYHINSEFVPLEIPKLGHGEYILYINYFGLQDAIIEKLKKQFSNQLIIDDTHAFFKKARPDLWSFTSARKYFGVPDGAYVYGEGKGIYDQPAFEKISIKHLELRAKGLQSKAFEAFQEYEKSIDCSVWGISSFSKERLSKINYKEVALTRKKNYVFLDRFLGSTNLLKFNVGYSVPFCYPYLPVKKIRHEELYVEYIYPPKFWKEVEMLPASDLERYFAKNILPLPIDHRYGEVEMKIIVQKILKIDEWYTINGHFL